MKTLKVQVTQEDIDTGIKGSSCRCPIAKALFRATNKIHLVACDYILDFLDRRWYPEPADEYKMKDFIENFDKGFKVSPMELNLFWSQ